MDQPRDSLALHDPQEAVPVELLFKRIADRQIATFGRWPNAAGRHKNELGRQGLRPGGHAW
jgi:hypothetical protein